MRSAPVYSIGAAARHTGLSADTIRSWERRYGLIRPRRDAGGTRTYGDDEIARLTLARQATELGHPIRRVAALNDRAIAKLIQAARSMQDTRDVEPPAADALLEALLSGDAERLKRIIVSAATLMEARDLILLVFVPLLRQVGVLWENGTLSIWQEHLLSDLISTTVGSLYRIAARRDADEGMLFATPPQELHAFGNMFASTIASSQGFRVHNLGVSVPVVELAAAAKRLDVHYVVIGITRTNGAIEDCGAYLHDLDRALPREIAIWVGGPSSKDLAKRTGARRVRAIPTLEEFAQVVEEQRGRRPVDIG